MANVKLEILMLDGPEPVGFSFRDGISVNVEYALKKGFASSLSSEVILNYPHGKTLHLKDGCNDSCQAVDPELFVFIGARSSEALLVGGAILYAVNSLGELAQTIQTERVPKYSDFWQTSAQVLEDNLLSERRFRFSPTID